MPTLGILFNTIGLIQPGQGSVVIASGTYPGFYYTFARPVNPYLTVLGELAHYETTLINLSDYGSTWQGPQ